MFSVDEIRRSLMSYPELDALRPSAPYVLEASSGRGELVYYGARHCWDPGDAQVLDISERFAAAAPQRAFNEGGWPCAGPPLVHMVRHHGEAGLLVYLAHEARIRWDSIEPPRFDEHADLAADIGPERAKLFLLLRDFDSYNRGRFPMPPSEYLKTLFDNWGRAEVVCPPSSEAELEDTIARLLPELRRWNEAPSHWFDPVLNTLPWLNQATARTCSFRDAAMVEKLVTGVRAGKRVFAVVGYSHVVMQERVLRRYLPDLRVTS